MAQRQQRPCAVRGGGQCNLARQSSKCMAISWSCHLTSINHRQATSPRPRSSPPPRLAVCLDNLIRRSPRARRLRSVQWNFHGKTFRREFVGEGKGGVCVGRGMRENREDSLFCMKLVCICTCTRGNVVRRLYFPPLSFSPYPPKSVRGQR